MVRDLKAKTGKLLDDDKKSADITPEPKKTTSKKVEKEVAPKVEPEISAVEDVEEVYDEIPPKREEIEDISSAPDNETSIGLEEDVVEEKTTIDDIDDEIARYYREQESTRKELEEKTRKVILEKTKDIDNSRDMEKEYASVLGNMSIDDEEEEDNNIGREILKEFTLNEDDFEGEEESNTHSENIPTEEILEIPQEDSETIDTPIEEKTETESSIIEDREDVEAKSPETKEVSLEETVEKEPQENTTTDLLKNLTSKLSSVSVEEKPKKTSSKTGTKKITTTSKSASKKSAKANGEDKLEGATKKSSATKGTATKTGAKTKSATPKTPKTATTKSTTKSVTQKSTAKKTAEEKTGEIGRDDTLIEEASVQDISREIDGLIDDMAKLNSGVLSREEKDEIIDSVVAEEIELSNEEKAEKVVEDIKDFVNNETVAPLSKGWEVDDYNKLVGINDVEQTLNPIETVSVDGKLDSSVALNDSDIDYLKEDKVETDTNNYFYGSDEHNEARAEGKSKEASIIPIKEVEVGDKNLNKDIANATPSSKVVPMGEDKTLSEEEKFIKEMELIYTMFGVEGKYKPTNLDDQKKILYVVTECQPFVATGGLADVAGSLPKAIAGLNMDIRVIMPLYGSIKDIYRQDFEFLGNFTVHLSWRQEYCGLFRYYSDGVTYYFVDNERYFKRDNLYGYFDDGERFAYFCKAVVEALPHLDFFPDIIHCNDWQSALVPVYVKTGDWQDNRYRQIKHIYTIHNVEYQGVYGMENLKDLFGIDEKYTHDLEYDGAINLTKAAIQLSDKVTTVSDSYCDNLKQPYCSRGLHHIIYRNEYKLSGIINGIDYDFYDPATDETIAYNFDINNLEGKRKCKKAWQEELGLPVDPDTPMLSMVTRLVSHKGLDLITRIMEDLLKDDIQFVIVGTGDQRFIEYFRWLEDKYPTKVRALVDKFSLEYARKNYAGSDIFIMPSKIEPCGISQMVASRYGTVPVVRECGGLKDTITDFGCEGGGNGYTFTNYNSDDLKYQLKRAISDYHDKDGWLQKMNTIMQIDFSWSRSAEKYVDLYKSLLK